MNLLQASVRFLRVIPPLSGVRFVHKGVLHTERRKFFPKDLRVVKILVMKLTEIEDLASVKFDAHITFRTSKEQKDMIRRLKTEHKKDPTDFLRKAVDRALAEVYGKTG